MSRMKSPEYPISLVHQRTNYDCVVASLAMVMGKTYEEVEELVTKYGMDVPMINSDYIPLLISQGFYPVQRSGYDPHPFINDCVYLVTVASRNTFGRTHMIVVDIRADGEIRVLDPSMKEKFTKEDWNIEFPYLSVLEIWDCRL